MGLFWIEIAVKWMEAVQTGLPVCALSALVGPLRLSREEIGVLVSKLIPWAIRCGGQSKCLMSVMYEEHFEEDMDAFRKSLNFEPAPSIDHQNESTIKT